MKKLAKELAEASKDDAEDKPKEDKDASKTT